MKATIELSPEIAHRLTVIGEEEGKSHSAVILDAISSYVTGRKPTYLYLEKRPHRWRKQLYLKGRNITVGQLIYSMRANSLNAEDAAYNLDLPVEQIKEAQKYYQDNKRLIEQEADEEKQRLIERGISLEPIHIP